MRNFFLIFLPLAFFLIANGELFSQRPNFGNSGSGGGSGMGRSGSSSGNQREIEPDTFPMFYHFPGEKNKSYAFVDSNLTNDFHLFQHILHFCWILPFFLIFVLLFYVVLYLYFI